MQRAFGRELEYDDIYRHLTLPQEVCLLRREGAIVAMMSHSRKTLSGIPSLIIEGVAVDPCLHGNRIYGTLLAAVLKGETAPCLRTQNPRLYAAHQACCSAVYPGERAMPGAVREIQKELAAELSCRIDENGVVQGCYGGLLYGQEPTHDRVGPLFKERLGMDLYRGDALLVVGIR